MASNNIAITIACIWMLTCITIKDAADTDITCLKAFKDSIQDPENVLSSWNFSKISQGSVCAFVGIECWNDNENRVLNIRLPNLGLKGKLPLELKNCTSLTGLDLSGNLLFGTLPINISDTLPYVTFLDLSSNNFSGHIPRDLANCVFLNVIKLDNNQFSGEIPFNLGRLARIREFSVANNSLYGQVPIFQNANISAESYAGNPGLCGGPLPHCQ